MFSSLTRRFFALLFAPLFALCLVTASGCEEGEIDGVDGGVENGAELEDGEMGEEETELEVEGE